MTLETKDARAIVAGILDQHIGSGNDQYRALKELAACAVHAMATILDVNDPSNPRCPLCRAGDVVAEHAHDLAGAPSREAVERVKEAVH